MNLNAFSSLGNANSGSFNLSGSMNPINTSKQSDEKSDFDGLGFSSEDLFLKNVFKKIQTKNFNDLNMSVNNITKVKNRLICIFGKDIHILSFDGCLIETIYYFLLH